MDKLNFKEVYWILARVGGFDGVSLQTFEYMKVLNKLGIKVNIITGLEETKYGDIDYGKNNHFLVKRLSFKHPESVALYNNSFTGGEEWDKGGWNEIFDKHKNKIKGNLKDIFLKKNIPIFVHNLISLRYMHPAAAVAIKELIEEFPERIFVSFSPDSDWERPENLERVRMDIKKIISCGFGDGLGPYNYDNLFYSVLNNKQKEVFVKDYKISEDKIFQIPDFMEFESPKVEIMDKPDDDFLDYLSKNCVYFDDGEVKYKKCNINEDTVFMLCPVRPVIRKKVKTSIFLAHQLKSHIRKNVVVVLTHPREEGVDFEYLDRCVSFAERMSIDLFFLGDSLKLSNKGNKANVWTLDDVYKNMACLNSLGMVMSDKGGWENAINEILKAGIPIFINSELNSFNQIKDDMKIGVIGLSLTNYFNSFKKTSKKDMKNISEIKKFLIWARGYHLAHNIKREKLVEYNYKKAYIHLSSEANEKKVVEMLKDLKLED